MVLMVVHLPLWQWHAACVLVFGVLLAWVILRRRSMANGRWLDRVLAAGGLGAVALSNGYWLQPERISLAKSLPLELCDVAAILAPIVLLTSWRPVRAVLHFWAFALCSQWLFTPVTPTGPETLAYWVSFSLHASILGTAAYDFAGRGLRPTWTDWRIAVVAGVVYAAVVLPMNVWIGANYGYVGNRLPQTWTIVHELGPWPWRVLVIATLAILAMAIVQLIVGPCGRWLDRGAGSTPDGANR